MSSSDHPSRTRRLERCAQACSLMAILFGCIGMAGWVLTAPVLQSLVKNWPAMVPNTALGFIAGGMALWGLHRRSGPVWKRRLAQGVALLVALLGIVTVTEYLLHWNPGIDQWLFKESVAQAQKVLPGRPAFLTATNFFLLGLAMILLDVRSRVHEKPSELLALTTLLVCLLALIGYVCKVPLFYGWYSLFPNSVMALFTATAFLALSIGVFCARPLGGLMGILTSDTAGGFMARRLLLAPVLVPLVIGWVKLLAQRANIYNADFAGWLFAYANIFVFTLIIWWCAHLLHRAEGVRRRAEQALVEFNTELEQRIEKRTVELSHALEAVSQLNAELEKRVQQRTAQLQASVSELEAFSYSVSHDLRAPLRHVAGFVELLREELAAGLTEPSRRHLEVITSSAQQMATLIDNLLSFSRMARAEMSYSRINSAALVREVRHELESECRNRNIVWQVSPLPDVVADRALLKQVWLNLLSNAIKYTRHQPRAEIRISSESRDDEVEFRVADNGAGFDMKYVDKLFGVFQRLHLTEEFEGTGIGLANVRRIILRHGGKTWAKAEVGVGATFYFTLPVVVPARLQP